MTFLKRAGNWRFLGLGLVLGHSKAFKWFVLIGLFVSGRGPVVSVLAALGKR